MTSLEGRRVVVTRTRERAAGLVDLLHARGAVAVVVPLIATEPLTSPQELEEAAAALTAAPGPHWAAFTSATAVRLVLGVARARLDGVRLAVVGPQTAAALATYGRRADVVAAEADAAGLARTMAAAGMTGATVWFPSAEGARDALSEGLRAAGAEVRTLVVYRSVMPSDAPRRLAAALDAGVDAVTLTSGSTARHLARALAGRALPDTAAVVCIGPQTADAARRCGFAVTAVAGDPSTPGLVAALDRIWSSVARA